MTRPKLKVLGSSPTKEGLTPIVNKYFYSICSLDFVAGKVSNGKGQIEGYSLTEKKGRYYFNEL